jgi:hypothetical protein
MEALRVVRRRSSPTFIDNGLTDGGEVFSLMRRLTALFPQEDPWHSNLFFNCKAYLS